MYPPRLISGSFLQPQMFMSRARAKEGGNTSMRGFEIEPQNSALKKEASIWLGDYRSITTRFAGVGRQFAIVQSIMVLHGGNAEIASQLGQGTRVTLLPAPVRYPRF